MNKPVSDYTAAEVLEILSSKGIFDDYKCPICGKSDVTVNSDILTMMLAQGFADSERVNNLLPTLVLLCKNCKNLQFFDATSLVLESETNERQ